MSESFDATTSVIERPVPQADADCCEVCSRLCCSRSQADESQPDNRCCSRAISIILAVTVVTLVFVGLVYLWAIPYSNAVAMMMWPDQTIGNIWIPWPQGGQDTGGVTAAGWAFHMFSIDFFILAVIVLIAYACSAGFKRNDSLSFCCPLVRKENTSSDDDVRCWDLCCGGWLAGCCCCTTNEAMFITYITLFCLSVPVCIVFLSYYAGPLIAFSTIDVCRPYIHTMAGFTTTQCKVPVFVVAYNQTVWVPVGGSYVLNASTWASVGGNAADCEWCRSVGFCILFFTIIGLGLLILVH